MRKTPHLHGLAFLDSCLDRARSKFPARLRIAAGHTVKRTPNCYSEAIPLPAIISVLVTGFPYFGSVCAASERWRKGLRGNEARMRTPLCYPFYRPRCKRPCQALLHRWTCLSGFVPHFDYLNRFAHGSISCAKFL